MTSDENKLQILKKVENGTLSIEEGADLLAILEKSTREPVAQSIDAKEPVDASALPERVPAGWQALWSLFIWIGVVFMGASAYWLYSSYARSGMGWGFWVAFIFLFLSTSIVYFGWRLVAGRWMVVRISSKEGESAKRFLFWAPLPIHMGIWVFKTFGKYMPDEVVEKHYESILLEMDHSLGKDEFFTIDIDGDQHVRINMEGKHPKKAQFNVEFD